MKPNILFNRFLRNMLFLFLSYLFIHSCLFSQPAAPNLISPADLAIKRPVNDSLKWSKVTGVVLYYKLQVSTDSLFLTTFQDVNVNSPDTVKLVLGMSYGVTYYWRVRTIRAVGDSSVWSTKKSFTTTPIITMTFPNGLENLKVDSTYNITWFSGGVAHAKIEYTTDGTSYTTIKDDTTGNSFPWRVPNFPATTYKVRITSLSDATITDRSDSTFTIMTPSLSITRPDLLESWKVDSTYNITWASPGLAGNVKIEYSTNSGSTYTTVTASTPSGAGIYPWSVPNFPSVNCKIRITHLTYPAFKDSSDVLFTILTPSITVISPNGGESWKVDSAYTIRWSTTGLSGNGRIEYSINGGPFTFIATNVSLASGSYNWTVPNVPGACKIKIYHVTHTSIADSSNATFSIMTPSITVTFPNGGENLKVDSTYNITWASSGLAGNVRIQYSINGGGLFTDIVASTPITGGSFPWTVPNTPSVNNCLIKISHAIYNTISDYSNISFTIVNPSITVTSPAGGETLSVDSTYNITWTSGGLSGNVKIDYSTNGGGSYTNIIASSPITTGSYLWTTPNAQSVNCKIKITHVTHSSLLATSAAFTILTPSLTVISPNGSESWDVGTSHDITWTRSGLAGNVKIEYSTDNGSSYSVISGSTPVGDGHYAWTVLATPSPDCKVRISHVLYPTVADSSNITFTIPPPPLAIISPNGGESWVVGSAHNITWTGTTIVGNLKIEYSTNSGASYTTIATGVSANLGTYIWTIPNTPTVANSCFVKLTHESIAGIVDSSNTAFRIPTPVLTIVAPNGGQSWKIDSIYNIQWTSVGSSGKVKIEYTTNNGTSYTTLVDSISAALGSYAWTIPFTPSAQCRVRITDIVYPTITTTSSATFTIPTPTITVTSPNGGESWLGGSPRVITWTNSIEVRNVKIEYTINNGGAWISIIDSIPSASATYNWTVPNTPSAQCRVRIKHIYYSSMVDSSDNVFTIPNNTIDLTSPNGGEGWRKGSVHNITWISTNITNVKIEYTSNNGTIWNVIIPTMAAAGGTYSWTVSNTLSALYKVRISDADQSYPIDTSNATFKVTDILLQSPNGSEQWQSGKTQNIIWTQTNITNIKIEYSIDNGSSWSVVIASTPAGTGTYPWTLPNTPSNQCLVKIRDADNLATVDSSDAVFTIMRLDVTSPNGGEYWQANSIHNITWLSAGVNNVRLQYSADSGSTWTTIITSTPAAAGSYSWTLPAIASNICKIRILNADYLPVNDLSDTTFSIFNLRLTYPVGAELFRTGSIKRILWTSSSITNLKIEYSINNGTSWSNAVASTPAATGYFDWTVPGTPSTNCRIRISDVTNSNIRDTILNTFTIFIGTITLSSPNGGERYTDSTVQNITWTSNGVDNIRISYSINGGSSYTTVKDSLPAISGTYAWTVPSTFSTNCKVKITDLTNATIADSSDAVFIIGRPDLIVSGTYVFVAGATTINITTTVTNNGNSKSIPTRVHYFLSTNTTIDASDKRFGDSLGLAVDSITWSGGASTQTVSGITLPVDIAPGTYYILWAVDTLPNQVRESNDNNNRFASATTIILKPDLVVIQDGTFPAAYIAPGWPLSLQATIKNQGNARTLTGCNLHYYLSLDQVISGADVLLGSKTAAQTGVLNAGQTSVQILSIASFPNPAEAFYYIGCVVDTLAAAVTESNEGNNDTWIGNSAVMQVVKPELNVVANRYSTPEEGSYSTGSATLYYTIQNTGTHKSKGCRIRFYMTTDNNTTYSAADLLVGTDTLLAIEPGENTGMLVYSKAFNQISGTPITGTWYFYGQIDYNNEVIERDDSQASNSFLFPIECGMINDIICNTTHDSSFCNPQIIGQGDAVTIYVKVENAGNVAVNNGQVTFKIIKASTSGGTTATVYTLGSVTYSLGVGQNKVLSLTYTFHDNAGSVAEGTYFLYWSVPGHNYWKTTPFPVHTHNLGMTITPNDYWESSTGLRVVAQWDTLLVRTNIENKNDVASAAKVLEFFISPTRLFPTSTKYAIGTLNVPALTANGQAGSTTTLILSNNSFPASTTIPVGTYYVGCRVQGATPETYYYDWSYSPTLLTVTAPKSDLIGSTIGSSVTYVADALHPTYLKGDTLIALLGDPININATVKNNRQATAAVNNYPLDFYLINADSVDMGLTPSSFGNSTSPNYIGFKRMLGNILGMNSTTFNATNLYTPINIPAGRYYVGWNIDPTDGVDEKYDDNNKIVLSTATKKILPSLNLRPFFFSFTQGVFPSLSVAAASSIDIPIIVNNVAFLNARTYQITLKYDPKIIKARNDITLGGTLSEGWKVQTETKAEGSITITASGNQRLSGNGTLLNLKFDIIGSVGQETVLQPTCFKYNSAEVPIQINTGKVKITEGTTNITKVMPLPEEYKLEQNYPNPFNPTSTIRYAIPWRSDVTIKIFDAIGREVKTLTQNIQDAGWYEVTFNASSMSSGIYFYVLRAQSKENDKSKYDVKKMLLIK